MCTILGIIGYIGLGLFFAGFGVVLLNEYIQERDIKRRMKGL